MAVDPENMTKDALISLVYDLQSQVETLLESQADNQVMEIQGKFKMTVTESRILSSLMDGRPHSKDSIFNAVWFDRMLDPPEMKIVDVMICKVRKKLFAYGVEIETIWGSGYCLTNRDRVIAALNGDIAPDMIADDAKPELRRKHGENSLKVLATLVSKMGADGKTKIGSRELARGAGLKGSLLPIMNRLVEKGAIQVKSQPTRHNRMAPWVVHVKARAL